MASMEYIFELTEGRRAVIYDEGSQIIIAFMAYGRIINQAVLEREYHSELNAITWGNNIYLAYVTVSNAIAWLQVGGTGRVIIYANDSSCRVLDLRMGEVNHKLLLFYRTELDDRQLCQLQYAQPLENRKSYMLGEWKKEIDYCLACVDDQCVCSVKIDGTTTHYFIEESDNQRYELKEVYILSGEEINNQKRLQAEQENKSKSEYEQLENSFRKQYNDLVEFAKQLQDEGKYWREMYRRSVQNIPKNT